MAKRRRDPGEGSIYWNESKERWEAAVSSGSGADRRRVSVSSRESRAAVRAKLEALRQSVGAASKVDPRQPLGDLVRSHYTAKASQLRVTTAHAYESQLAWIERGLGHVRLCDATVDVIGAFYMSLQGKLAPSTIHSIRRRLKTVFNAAIKAGALKTNPARDAPCPRLPRLEIHPFDETDSAKILKALETDRFEAFAALGLLRGLRIGEILGLRWPYLDFERAAIQIEWSLQPIPDGPGKGRLALLEVKTDSARRSISMPREVMDILLRRRQHQLQEQILAGSRWAGNEHDLVMTTSTGRPIWPCSIRKGFSRLQKRLGIHPHRRPHDMRHTCAALMLQDRENPALVSKLLGHSSVAFTLQVYGHLIPGAESDASQRLADRIFSKMAG